MQVMKSVKQVYSVRLSPEIIQGLQELSESLGLEPATIIRIAVDSLVKQAKENNNEITLPFKQTRAKKPLTLADIQPMQFDGIEGDIMKRKSAKKTTPTA